MSENLFGRVILESVTTAIKDGTHGTHARASDGVPFLSAKNITDSGTVSWDEADDCISESEYEQIHRTFRLQPRDLLLTIVGSLGRRAVFDGSKVTFQRSVAYVRPDTQRVSERFLFHWFAHDEFQQELVRRSNSTAQAGLYLGELARTSVPECPLVEQVKIAEVLDTLDATIRQTEAIIQKLKQVKQGLLHDLLTRGIDANGELRPPQSQAPHLYKDSPLGWIPREWDMYSVNQVSESVVDGPFGSNLKTEHYVPLPGVRVVRLQNIGIGDYDDNERAYVSELKASTLSRNQVVGGDVLVAALGDERYPVGRACCYPVNLPPAVNKADCFRLRPRAEFAIGPFVMRSLNGATARRQVRGFEQGVTMQRVNLGNLKRVLLSMPPVAEQQLICERLAVLDGTIAANLAEVSKLRVQKSGLMDDLLTGRVRVTRLLATDPA
jgi:type I restriction enzyme, S subunit